eukprot:CAMPEP_0174259514 /NCGR_PEP_ID=MMETSP0439-20130205/8325_1 /TAXON_ID=0 /ORGANISM="Stereomyxa ramosa, Strain Chinc5" /LENGTH=415 /DNA_ID=CAMNT_0015343423 /DNA_START=78 /DNA_END=1325 /DNA_ORIENTATION=+
MSVDSNCDFAWFLISYGNSRFSPIILFVANEKQELINKGRVTAVSYDKNSGDPTLDFTISSESTAITLKWKLLIKDKCPQMLQTIFRQYKDKADGSHINFIGKSIERYLAKSLSLTPLDPNNDIYEKMELTENGSTPLQSLTNFVNQSAVALLATPEKKPQTNTSTTTQDKEESESSETEILRPDPLPRSSSSGIANFFRNSSSEEAESTKNNNGTEKFSEEGNDKFKKIKRKRKTEREHYNSIIQDLRERLVKATTNLDNMANACETLQLKAENDQKKIIMERDKALEELQEERNKRRASETQTEILEQHKNDCAKQYELLSKQLEEVKKQNEKLEDKLHEERARTDTVVMQNVSMASKIKKIQDEKRDIEQGLFESRSTVIPKSWKERKTTLIVIFLLLFGGFYVTRNVVGVL